jgi:beta-galactosidase
MSEITMAFRSKPASPSKRLKILGFAFFVSEVCFARGPDFPVEFQGGAVTFERISTTYDSVNPDATKSSTYSSDGQHLMLDFGFNTLGFAGDFSTNWFTAAAESDFKFKYGDRLFRQTGGDKAEVYKFDAERIGDDFDVKAFYHVPRYHWGYEGDFFGLMYETTNMYDQDIWNEKAPAGIEFIGKGSFEGLKIVGGKEIYWGAHPLIMTKYMFGDSKQYSVVVEQDVADRVDRQRVSVQGTVGVSDSVTLRAGFLSSGSEKIGNTYDVERAGVVTQDTIRRKDTFASMLRLESEVGNASTAYLELNHAGLVASRGEFQEIWDTEVPYSQLGNKKTIELGARLVSGSMMLSPRLFVRKSLEDALSLSARGAGARGTNARTSQDENFAVYDNRDARAVELYFTYDPTPGTFFYEWDNFLKEDAKFAFNLGITKTNFSARTDIRSWSWGDDWGRDSEKIEKLTSRFVYNPFNSLKITGEIEAGHQMPLFGGNPDNRANPTSTEDNLSQFLSIDTKFVYGQKNIFSVVYKNDAYGEYDWYADYGTSFPRQLQLGYERLLDDTSRPSKIGFMWFKRDLNSGSGGDWQGGQNDSMRELQLYYVHSF